MSNNLVMQEWGELRVMGETMNGYCWLHDRDYKINEPDDVCPQCLKNKEQDLRWRDSEDEI